MSTATEEPPKIPAERASIAADFLRPKVQTDVGVVKSPEPPEVKKVEEPPKTEVKKEDAPPVKTEEVKPDPREQNIGELRKMRDEARKQHEEAVKLLEAEKAERARIAAEYETFKKNPVPKEFEEKLTKAEQERQRLDRELQATSVERSSYYKETFKDPINAHATLMRDVMVQSGMTLADANKAIGDWDENAFVQAAQEMNPVQEVKFKAAWMETIRLDTARREVLSKADEHAKKLEQQQQEQMKLQQEQQQQWLKSEQESLFKELFAQDHLKDNVELQKAAREAVDASYQMPPKEIMKQVAAARLLAEGIQIKDKALTELQAKYDELKKKHDEAESFIKNQNGSTARISPSDPSGEVVDKKTRAASFLNPTFGNV